MFFISLVTVDHWTCLNNKLIELTKLLNPTFCIMFSRYSWRMIIFASSSLKTFWSNVCVSSETFTCPFFCVDSRLINLCFILHASVVFHFWLIHLFSWWLHTTLSSPSNFVSFKMTSNYIKSIFYLYFQHPPNFLF